MTAAASMICAQCRRVLTDGGTAGSGPDHGSPPMDAAAVTAGWLREAGAGGVVTWVCPACVRRHIRSIEARLDDAWW